ncbi:DUF3667 domain-containing protein [Caulobacter mirabilis]|uniref:DUF3667 domain-containing protein n=1 Tax=Caulobacter mirabilis TaxID=69666 RepID=A0A2D2AX80_9CAUL|nr:DUF3667 domain-containing protein [Caulobacter mirabilis]ATQ42630.1 hypothetical protein CSW64_09525 [Caulobacter mirabilis]
MKEVEAITGGALGGWMARFKSDGTSAHEPPPPGTRCMNCETELTGRFCHACGQEYADHHRSILHLTWETIESMFHVDGRLWRTVPRLFLDPGRLSKEYFDGKRARHVPPFRTFLVSLLIFILAAELVLHKWTHDLKHAADHPPAAEGQAGRAEREPGYSVNVTTPEGVKTGRMVDGKVVDEQGKVLADGLPTPRSILDEIKREGVTGENPADFNRKLDWFDGQLKKTVESPEYFMMIAFGWGHRLAVLLLPIFAAFLALMYFYRRKIFVYDHLIVSMNYLSFTFLSFAIALLLPAPVKSWALLAATIWSPVNLFMTLRGAYGSGVVSALVKTSVLWVATICLFLFLVVGLMAIGFYQI